MRSKAKRSSMILALVLVVAGFLGAIFAPAVSAAAPIVLSQNDRWYLPNLTSNNKLATLVIGRLGVVEGSRSSLPVQSTQAKLIYDRIPDTVDIADGTFCRASENAGFDDHTFNNACNSTDIHYETNFEFQAFNNETGAPLGAAKLVKGSSMVSAGFKTVSLAGLAGVAPSTDGKYFVSLKASWAFPNPSTCKQESTTAQGCWGGTNGFIIKMPNTTDFVTYPATDTSTPPLAILAAGTNSQVDPYSDYTFRFAPKCNASGAALKETLEWEDADYGESNQKEWIGWELYDDTENTGTPVASAYNSDLGGQGGHRSKPITFKLNHKYRWVWRHVSYNNGLNIFLPYDGYDYIRDCTTITPPPPPPPPPPPVYVQPYFNVNGGDVSVGQGMSTGGVDCAVDKIPTAGIAAWNRGSANNFAGAGGQYAAYVLNHLQEFATAQGGTSKPTGLSFANNTGSLPDTDPTTGYYGGKFAGGTCTMDYYAKAPSEPLAVNRSITELTGFPAGGNVPNGTNFTRYVKGDLYINSNVRFSGNYPSTNDIPVFKVVVKGNIYVDKSVTQLDGIYIAQPTNNTSNDGNFYTCATGSGTVYTAYPLTTQLRANCSTSLVINGSVTARRFWPMRTSGDLPTGPAETINYLPELWMSTNATTTSGGGGKYDAITGLPPVL